MFTLSSCVQLNMPSVVLRDLSGPGHAGNHSLTEINQAPYSRCSGIICASTGGIEYTQVEVPAVTDRKHSHMHPLLLCFIPEARTPIE